MADASPGPANSQELVYWWAPRGEERVFDLSGWPDEALAMTRALLDEDGMTHSWEGTSLVVGHDRRDDAAALLDEVVAASNPGLDADSDRTAYDLAEWPDYEIELLGSALEDEGILHEWTDAGELLVYEADEARVDVLFERLDLRGPDPGIELDGEALTTLLTNLFVAADRLAGDPDDADAVLAAHASVLEVQQLAVPYGMNPDGWQVLVADAVELRRLIEAEAGGAEVSTGGADDTLADVDEHARAADGDDAAADDGAGDGTDAAGDVADDEAMEVFGDDAIRLVAGRVRDHLRRIL